MLWSSTAKLSSEGEVDPDSFSDISDDESEMYRSLQAARHTKVPLGHSPDNGSRASVITSSALTNGQSPSESSDSAARVQAGEPEMPIPGPGMDLTTSPSRQSVVGSAVQTEKKTDQPKPKPKIWSISHILDS
ncbi:hypothetical protein PoB_002674200 [Plakobranchus ocellatus]|uniref:Uncharacterized protein n=1 Tax=Plakobranchus ocellatus TaxID=259542 RepID=A0AAV4A071_9GAST|nr:hypothetical protein PoB_002674200 [Plakobranchus ocellatus]